MSTIATILLGLLLCLPAVVGVVWVYISDRDGRVFIHAAVTVLSAAVALVAGVMLIASELCP